MMRRMRRAALMLLIAIAGLADLQASERSGSSAVSRTAIRKPTGPAELPQSLPGRWKASLCISEMHNHAWIRFENPESGEVRTVSRFHLLVGAWFDAERFRWNYGPTTRAGVYTDREQSLEKGIAEGKYVLVSAYVENPVIYRGENEGRGHGMIQNNCCTYTRDCWYRYTGEWYPLHPTVHEPRVLLQSILARHPEVRSAEQ
jgi:hypothetical protein